MTNNPKELSIIIPIYNGSKYINNLINNVVNLNKNIDYEIILVNDNSKDNSKLACESIINSNSNINITLINNDENIGVAESRNKGLEIAKGKYITFVDQDDKLTKEYSSYINILNNDDTIDFLYSNYSISSNNKIENISVNSMDKECKKEEIIKLERYLFNSNTFPINDNYSIRSSIWNCIFRKSFIDDNNLRFFRYTSYEDDWLFLIESLKHANKIYLTKDYYYCWVIHNNNESKHNKYINDYFNKSIKLLEYAIDSLKQTGLRDEELKDYISQSNRTILLWNFYNECEKDTSLHNNKNINMLIDYYHHDLKEFIKISNVVDKTMLTLIMLKMYNLVKFLQLNILKRKYV